MGKRLPAAAETRFDQQAAEIAQTEAESKKLKAKASLLASELAALLKHHQEYLQRVKEAQALLSNLSAAQYPPENAALKVKRADVENRENEVKQLRASIDKLSSDLDQIRKTNPDKQLRLDDALEKINRLKTILQITSRSKAVLESDLAKAEQARQNAAQSLFDANKERDDDHKKLPEKARLIDFSKGQSAAIQDKSITSKAVFLCRSQKIAYLDFAPLENSVDVVMKNLVQDNHQVTYSNLMRAVNDAKISSDAFALTCAGPYNYQNKTYLRFEISPKIGASWEGVDQLNAQGSAFRAKLGSLDKRSTGIRFLVWDDSFDLYLKAAFLAKSAGFSVNWEPYAADQVFGSFFPHDENTDGNLAFAEWEKE